MLLAARLGEETYRSVCNASNSQLLGERLFRDHAYSEAELSQFAASRPLRADLASLFEAVRPAMGPLLDTLTRQVLAARPAIVGITTNFQQNMAAFALARRIKARAPQICVVVGGANISEPMGSGLMSVFPFVDHFFSGEADVDFPRFCEEYLAGRRGHSKLVDCRPISDMRAVSAPDYIDFFKSLRHYQKRGRLSPGANRYLVLESSRGCWWGERSHCTFCGLNTDGMAFRQKEPQRVLSEIRTLMDDWQITRIHMSDNIMPLSFFKTVLPELARWERKPDLFYESKSNLKDEQIDSLAAAGVHMIQPGIESFSSRLLKLMRKGVTAGQNIALLRSCRSRGVGAYWNLLYGFPGELREDYIPVIALLPKLVHLPPPTGLNPIIIDRFSPYHKDHRDFGISEISPSRNYTGLYPPGAPLVDIAYQFSGRFTTPLLQDTELVAQLRQAVGEWTIRWNTGARAPRLELHRTAGGGMVVMDSRGAKRPALHPLSPSEDAALRYFERPRPAVADHGAHTDHIARLLRHDLLVAHEDVLLSVVVRPDDNKLPNPRESAARDLEPV
jgi:ribosomal peptide maturation radical SAM protein 1